MKLNIACLAVLLLLIASSALAEDRKFELTPFGGAMFGGTIETENEETGEKGDDLDLDNSASYGLIFNA
ncbi:MAG: hypothetical protein OEU86_06130, partial [Gammaproteobacteria bacterium]|nr:hypothetical protein [Gammaproteobacteria bacterium]